MYGTPCKLRIYVISYQCTYFNSESSHPLLMLCNVYLVILLKFLFLFLFHFEVFFKLSNLVN